jgi:hypothetical protein
MPSRCWSHAAIKRSVSTSLPEANRDHRVIPRPFQDQPPRLCAARRILLSANKSLITSVLMVRLTLREGELAHGFADHGWVCPEASAP